MSGRLITLVCLVVGAQNAQADSSGPDRNLKKQSAPIFSIDAKAVRVLQQATSVYKGAKSLSFRYQERIVNENYRIGDRGYFAFARPNLLRVTNEATGGIIVENGVRGVHAHKSSEFETHPPSDAEMVTQQAFGGWGTEYWIHALLSGNSLLEFQARQLHPKGVFRVRYLPPRRVEGELVEGVQIRADGVYKDLGVWTENTGWFGVNDHLLRRTQSVGRDSNDQSSYSNRLFDIVLNPKLASNVFEFVPPQGAKEIKRK